MSISSITILKDAVTEKCKMFFDSEDLHTIRIGRIHQYIQEEVYYTLNNLYTGYRKEFLATAENKQKDIIEKYAVKYNESEIKQLFSHPPLIHDPNGKIKEKIKNCRNIVKDNRTTKKILFEKGDVNLEPYTLDFYSLFLGYEGWKDFQDSHFSPKKYQENLNGFPRYFQEQEKEAHYKLSNLFKQTVDLYNVLGITLEKEIQNKIKLNSDIFIDHLFDEILSSKNLIENDFLKKSIEEVCFKNGSYWQKAVVVNALNVSILNEFCPQKLDYLVRVLMQKEFGVWNRALIGIILGCISVCQNSFYEQLVGRTFDYINSDSDFHDDVDVIISILIDMQHKDWELEERYAFEKKYQYFVPFRLDMMNQLIEKSRNINYEELFYALWYYIHADDNEKMHLLQELLKLPDEEIMKSTARIKNMNKAFRLVSYELERKCYAQFVSGNSGIFIKFMANFFPEKYKDLKTIPIEILLKATSGLTIKPGTRLHFYMEYCSKDVINNYLEDLIVKDIAGRPEEYEYVGNILSDKGEYTQARYFLEKAVEIQPRNSWYWHELGLSLLALNHTEEAVAAFWKGGKVYNKNLMIWDTLGQLLTYLGRKEEALEVYTIISLFKNRQDYLETFQEIILSGMEARATLLAYFGQIEESKKVLEEILSIDPDHPSAPMHLLLLQEGITDFLAVEENIIKTLNGIDFSSSEKREDNRD